ncbi:unnamed protein product [Staurois parvus]|uniref:FXYD domain-containing ion transport regulator n=1 Tax=Staurois parvus TaxID=386267 RepID=A0ABN9ENC4_9NEOB|nr:unnamed protein product [Staurois parvus]
MTSCRQTLRPVKILLLLSLVLPVTAQIHKLTSPSATTEPESSKPFTTSFSHESEADQTTEGGVQASSTAGLDIGIEFPALTTPLADTEPTTTQSSTTSMYRATTRRGATTSEDTIHTRAKDAARRLEHEKIFTYDYLTLRQWGLICALLLCIIGFLVLFSGRCRGFSCRDDRGGNTT